MSVSKKEVLHVAYLARLDLQEAEVEKFTEHLNEILEYVEKLKQLDVTNVEPTAHVIPMQNVLREDQEKTSLNSETAINNAAEHYQNYIQVPRVVE